jgi:hypothetical protein
MADKQSLTFPDHVLENLLADMEEHARLKTLTNEELVMECLEHDQTDCAVVDEMCDRLWPKWAEEGH